MLPLPLTPLLVIVADPKTIEFDNWVNTPLNDVVELTANVVQLKALAANDENVVGDTIDNGADAYPSEIDVTPDGYNDTAPVDAPIAFEMRPNVPAWILHAPDWTILAAVLRADDSVVTPPMPIVPATLMFPALLRLLMLLLVDILIQKIGIQRILIFLLFCFLLFYFFWLFKSSSRGHRF
jgi:hypothetical protein